MLGPAFMGLVAIAVVFLVFAGSASWHQNERAAGVLSGAAGLMLLLAFLSLMFSMASSSCR